VKKILIHSSAKSSKDPLQMFEFQAYSSSGVNVAVEGNATQSSDFSSKTVASKAIDAINSTFSHTASEEVGWWELDLKDEVHIEKTVIINRWCGDPSDPYGCLCRLSEYELLFYNVNGERITSRDIVGSDSNNTCNETIITKTFSNPECTTCLATARKIRVQSTTMEQIQMFELQAFSSGTNMNIALSGSAIQSSTLHNATKFAASNAIDGNSLSFSHTDDYAHAYWEVDLGAMFDLESVIIMNRWCGDKSDPNRCLCRLTSASVMLLDDNDSTIADKTLGNTCGELIISESFASSCNPTASPVIALTSKIKLELATGEPIQIFELEAYSSGKNVALNATATQSSDFNSKFVASNAVDGSNTTFSHTAVGDTPAYLEVYLGDLYSIDSVTVMNRYCVNANDANGCLCRLTDATLTLLGERDDSVIAQISLGNTCSVLEITAKASGGNWGIIV
jgi:hypothetical protein